MKPARFPVPHVYQPRILGSRLSKGARLVAFALCQMTDGATSATTYQPTSLRRIAELAGYKIRRARTLVRELEQAGYVARTVATFGEDGAQRENVYHLNAAKFGPTPRLARTDPEPGIGPLELEARAAASAELVRALELSPAKTARRA